MHARPGSRARFVAAGTALLLIAGLGTAAPSLAKAKAKATKTTVTASHATAGSKFTLTASVTPRPSGGTVRFSISGRTPTSCAKVALHSGKARCTTTAPKAGKRSLVAKYSGKRTKFTTSTGRRTVTVAAEPTATKPTATPKAAASIVGSTGSCTLSSGALVAVSYATWNGPIVRGCDTTPTTGIDLLKTANFTTTGTQHDGPQFLCRIGNPIFDSGTQYPTPATEKCVNTPPASAYWSYWLAAKGTNTWTYASLGAYSQKTVDGDVQAWTYGSTDVNGTTGRPSFTPGEVRAGMSASKATPQLRRLAAAPKQADQAKATKYLTDNLVDGSHYEPFGAGFTDYGLTIDGAYALAATGDSDATLGKITDYVAEKSDSWTGIGTDYPSGGSIGKLALLLEMTGLHADKLATLLTALQDATCSKEDQANYCYGDGNYESAQSVFSQSLGVIAQLRAKQTDAAARPVAFLSSLQKADGSFPSTLPGDESAGEVDSTAMAAMALDLAGDTAAVDKALTWIAGQQKPDGGFPGAAGNSTNSAALAILGLTLGGTKYGDEIDAAEDFLATQQNADGGFHVAADDGYGSDVRASTQVVSGLAGISFGTVSDDVAAPAAAEPDAGKGADWVTSQLVDGNRLESTFGDQTFVDYGGTADVAFALAAAGGRDAALIKVMKYLRDHLADYVDPAGAAGGPYGGAAGKLATLAETTGQDPTDFGGTDLLALLRDHVCAAANDSGSCSAAGDFDGAYSSVSQAFGVLALARHGDTVPAPALARLLQLQCTDGGFSSTLLAAGGDCTSEVDTTGFAVQALTLVRTDEARDSVAKAVGYLRGQQNDDGSWDGAVDQSTNSTSLAVQGLLAAPASADVPVGQVRVFASRSDPAVRSGRAFLATLQNGDGGFGISPASTGSDVRASTQSVVAAASAALSTLLHPVSLAAAPGDGVASGSAGSSGNPGSSGSSNTGSADSPDAGNSATPVAGSTDATADTGTPVGQLIGIALALLLAGAVLLIASRRRSIGFPSGGRHR